MRDYKVDATMSSVSIIEYLNENGILWMPINLEISISKQGKVKKNLKAYHEDRQMPSYNDFSESEMIKNRMTWAGNYKYIWIDTRFVNQIDVDGDYDPELDTPYFESITKKKRHYFVRGFYGISRKRVQTKWTDVELLSGQGSYASKECLVYHSSSDIQDYTGRTCDVLPENVKNQRKSCSTLNIQVMNQLNSIFKTTGNWKMNCYDTNRTSCIVLIPESDKQCLTQSGKVHSCVQSYVCIGKTSCTARCYTCSETRINTRTTEWKAIRNHFQLEDSSSEDSTSYASIQSYLDEYCTEHDLVKKDGYMMRRSAQCQIEYEKVNNFGTFLDELFKDASTDVKTFYKKPTTKKNLEEYLNTIHTDIFQLKRDSNVIAFTNGYLKLKEMKFYEYDESVNYTFIAKKYIPLNFDAEWLTMEWNEIECPIFDKIVQDQPQISSCDDVKLAFYGLLGSLHYPNGSDSIKVVPYLVGTSGTGKSTIVNIYSKTFSSELIGTINYKERTFGKTAFLEKDVIIDSDTPADMIQSFGKTEFQKAVSGETIAIPVKNQKREEQHQVWNRMLFCSQYTQSGPDTGEVIRRIAYFGFEPVENTKVNLEADCVETELNRVLVKTILARKKLIEKYANTPFHEWNISYFDSRKDDILIENNYVFRMISEHPLFKVRKGARCSFDVFTHYFMEHFRGQPSKPKMPKKTDVMFTKMGLRVNKEIICKDCKQLFNLHRACCQHYQPNNRSIQYFIEDLCCESNLELFSG